MRSTVVLTLSLLCFGALRARAGEAAPILVPLVLHVAQQDGVPVASEEFLSEQLARANAIYGPLGIELVVIAKKPVSSRHARLVERRDRDALQVNLQQGVVNCFVVATLMDVDEPGRERRGVHWRVRAAQHKHFVVVSALAGRPPEPGFTFQPSYVLAHELGHYFGNQEHSDVPGNLMSYQHTDSVPVLNASQQQRVLQTVTGMLGSGELTRVTKPARRTTQ